MTRRTAIRSGRPGGAMRLIVAAVMIAVALFSYFGSQSYNPVTGEEQYISLTPEQEIALGLQSTPAMIQEYGGMYPDDRQQAYLDQIGFSIVNNSIARQTEWQYEFYLLNDPQTINAFALPGGQVFITKALFDRLKTEGQLAGVLGHEIGHVVARHGAEHIATAQLSQGVIEAVLVASESDKTAQAAQFIAQLINLQYGRDDELESDYLGIRFMSEAGYDPYAMIGVMEILAEAAGDNRQPEFFSTHPNPENRIEEIRAAIAEFFPNGVPERLKQ